MGLEHRVKAKSQSGAVIEAAMGKEEGPRVERMKQGDCKGLGKSHRGLNQSCIPENRMEGKERGRFQRYLNVNLTRLDDPFRGEEVGTVDEGFPFD